MYTCIILCALVHVVILLYVYSLTIGIFSWGYVFIMLHVVHIHIINNSRVVYLNTHTMQTLTR